MKKGENNNSEKKVALDEIKIQFDLNDKANFQNGNSRTCLNEQNKEEKKKILII